MNEIHAVPGRTAGPGIGKAASASGGPAREPVGGRVPELKPDEMTVEPSHEPSPGDEQFERRIAELRARIADGTYLTPDKIDAAVEALFRELFGE
ncbi:MAG: hypothetical protein AB1716_06855 [Planctomycetota bacterium]